MAGLKSHGPPLDPAADEQIREEEKYHRQQLLGIERTHTEEWSDLLAAENARHIKRLTQIYSALATRALDRSSAAADKLSIGSMD